MSILFKVLKVIGIIILVIIGLIILLIIAMSLIPMVPNNYTEKVETGGNIERKYLSMGNYKVRNIKRDGSELTKKYTIYYPEELENSNQEYPAIIVLNGTGVLPKKYKALFKHLASWGFIVIGNDDASTGFGTSADETIDYIISENSNNESILYKTIDLDNIGITGHSQGGAGVFSALSIMKHKDVYKTSVALSPTHEQTAHELGWNYDLTKISTPILMIAGTEGDFETQAVIPIEKMTEMYNKIPALKVMARRSGAEHGQMLYSADGYVTAWFMWQLKGDEEASKAFIGDSPEIINNSLYRNQKIDIL